MSSCRFGRVRVPGTVVAAGGKHGGDLLAFPGDLGRFGLTGSLPGVMAGQTTAQQPRELSGHHGIISDPTIPVSHATTPPLRSGTMSALRQLPHPSRPANTPRLLAPTSDFRHGVRPMQY